MDHSCGRWLGHIREYRPGWQTLHGDIAGPKGRPSSAQGIALGHAVRGELHAYASEVLKSLECPSLAINSVEDHIHILCLLSRKIAVMKLIEEIKTSTSKWIKTKGVAYRGFYWQGGYGAFSVSESKCGDVERYIRRQHEHHKRRTFQDEFRQLCAKHRIPIDERYVWD